MVVFQEMICEYCDGTGEEECPECGGPDEEHGMGHMTTCRACGGNG